MTKRFYVAATWDNFPTDGSYTTTVEAESHDHAERMCLNEMAASCAEDREGSDSLDLDQFYNQPCEPEYWLNRYSDQWHVVVCFDIDEFIEHYKKPLA